MSHLLDSYLKSKQPEHDKIALQTAEFEAAGGVVTVHGNNVYHKPCTPALNFRDAEKRKRKEKDFKNRVNQGVVK